MNMELWRFWFFLSTKETLTEREREHFEMLNWLIGRDQ